MSGGEHMGEKEQMGEEKQLSESCGAWEEAAAGA